jgi:hypothetical protein
MATHDSTASIDSLTESQKLEQFPMSGMPFVVWFCKPDEHLEYTVWAINDKNGDAVGNAENYREAIAISKAFMAEALAHQPSTM